jgi:general secretion pathway protein F
VGLLMSGCVLAYLSGWVELNLWLGGGAAALLLAWRHPVGRKLADAATLAVPGPGWLLRTPVLRYHRAMFFSALGRSLDVGLDLQRGLRLAIETLPNHRVRQDLAQAQAALAGGANLGDAFAPCVTLEPGQRLGIATGEQSGQLPAVLDAQAASERALLEHWTAQYTRLLPVGLLLLTVFGLAARVL